MRTHLKIKFLGFPPYHDPHQQSYFRRLCERYDIDETGTPDFIIDGGLSFHHIRTDCVKILLCSENIVPDFNLYDYAVGCYDLNFGDRYVRIPWFPFYDAYPSLPNRTPPSDNELLNRKFCSFVVSNAIFADPIRAAFFRKLSTYKAVDSGGSFLNNVGGPVPDKIAFCRNYKFNIAFENSSSPGYTTEKIMEAYLANSVPIYFGNPTVETDFNPDSMIRIRSEKDFEPAINRILELDRNDQEYLRVCKAPCCAVLDPLYYQNKLDQFLFAILDQDPASARRRNQYGYQGMIGQHMKRVLSVDQSIRDSLLFKWTTRAIGSVRKAFR